MRFLTTLAYLALSGATASAQGEAAAIVDPPARTSWAPGVIVFLAIAVGVYLWLQRKPGAIPKQ